jgi:DUF4097 and DUF4098 domain-containing protein YvlB
MRVNLAVSSFAFILLRTTGCNLEDLGDVGRYNREFHYSYPLKPGGRISVESFNGSVEISSWNQGTVDISGTKYGPTQSAADTLLIETENAADSVSVRAVRPSDRRNNTGARFVIKIPQGTLLNRINTSNGGIRIQDGTGPARLKTSNGGIRVQTLHGSLDAETSNSGIDLEDIDGDVLAHSSNGHIHADRLRGALDATTSNSGVTGELERADRPVRVETSNGSVDLKLPPSFTGAVRVNTNNSGIAVHLAEPVNAELSARTSNSSVSCDFDVRVHGQNAKSHMTGTIGSGGPLMELTSSNGSIRVMRR